MTAEDALAARRTRLLSGPVPPLLWSLSWPVSLGLFSVIAFNVIDTLYIGRLGADELAAIGYCFPVIFSLSAIAIGVGNGAASVIARRIGAEEWVEARELVFNSLIFVVGAAISLAIFMIIASDSIFRLLGAPDRLLPFINQYMDVWYLGLPFLILPIVLNSLVRASGEAVVPSALMVVGAFINAALSPVMVFGLFDTPAMGMAGAAWATIAARAVMSGLCFWYLLRTRLIDVTPKALRHFFPCVREVLSFGAPAFAAQLVSPICGAVIVRLLSGQGPEAVAAYTVGARIEALLLVPFFALQTGIGPFIGQNVGAGETARLRRAEKSVWVFALAWGAIAAVLMICFGGRLAGFFTEDPAIQALSDQYLGLVALGLWGAGLMIVGGGVFNPLGYPNVGMVVSALRYLLFYAGTAILVVKIAAPDWQVIGIFGAAPFSYAMAGIIAIILMHRLLGNPRSTKGRTVVAPRKIVGHDDLRPYRHPTEPRADEHKSSEEET